MPSVEFSREAMAMTTSYLQGELPSRWRVPFERSFGQQFDKIRVLSGSDVDKSLARQKALAQALDSRTIALSTRLAQLPEEMQFLIIGHELAHTVQLGRSSSEESVPALEAEAWLAAHRALQGVTHSVRGGAGHPLCAALAIIDGDGQPHAGEYYKTFKWEPICAWEGITIDKVVELNPISLESVLDTIIRDGVSPNRDILIVAHGDWNGLTSIPLVVGGPKWALGDTDPPKRNTLYLLLEAAESTATTSLHLTTKQLNDLRTKVDKVRKRGLRHLALRACLIGNRLDVLQNLQAFFGAASSSAPKGADTASAPTAFDTYGLVDPGSGNHTDGDDWDTWDMIRGSKTIYGDPPNRFALRWWPIVMDGQTKLDYEAMKESAPGVQDFIKKHLPPSSYRYTRGTFPIHGIWDGSSSWLSYPADSDYVNYIQYNGVQMVIQHFQLAGAYSSGRASGAATPALGVKARKL